MNHKVLLFFLLSAIVISNSIAAKEKSSKDKKAPVNSVSAQEKSHTAPNKDEKIGTNTIPSNQREEQKPKSNKSPEVKNAVKEDEDLPQSGKRKDEMSGNEQTKKDPTLKEPRQVPPTVVNEIPKRQNAEGEAPSASNEHFKPSPKSTEAPKVLSTEKEVADNLPEKGHILFFHTMGSRSHLIAMSALAEGLVQHGHKVTTVFYAKSKIVHENYKEILIEDKIADIYKRFSKMYMENGGNMLDPKLWYEGVKTIKASLSNACTESLTENPELIQMIEQKVKVDVVITMSSCGSVLAHFFDSPIIFFSPAGPFGLQLAPGLGNPINPVVQPHIVAPFIEPMSFTQRISNVLLDRVMNAYVSWMDSLFLESVRNHFGDDIPDFNSIIKERSAFAIVNSHFVTHGSWPLYQNLVEVGGIHCKPGKELPKDLKEYLDSHPEGVVYVSFGSALSPSAMTEEQKNVFFETFRELKNVPIIWKWDDDDLSRMPENVLVRKWLPQNDLLAHPNLKVFVTHGGLLSTQEALFHSVPLVGVPISNDQKPNLLRAQKHGYAIMLTLQTMTKEELKASILKAMTDENMKTAMNRMHDLFTENNHGTPVSRGVRAVEYVIKHKNLDFLKSNETMFIPFYEWYGFDVLAFVLILSIFISWITLKTCRCCARRCCYKKTKQD